MSTADRSGQMHGPCGEPLRSLRNHARVPRDRSGRPKMLGHEGHPAGLSNGKKPELPAR